VGAPVAPPVSTGSRPMYEMIHGFFTSIRDDLQGINAYRYQNQISPGMQEYVEALLFQHYLETGRIMIWEEAAQAVPGRVLLTHDDYLLGLFDMTGELMRFAITYLATNGSLPESSNTTDSSSGEKANILTDLQQLRANLEGIDARASFALARDFESKLKTTRASVEKVEYGVYNMLVRGKERPKGWRPDASITDAIKDADNVDAY
jgi:predicted translin family RNA/ssDNA-binding protein